MTVDGLILLFLWRVRLNSGSLSWPCHHLRFEGRSVLFFICQIMTKPPSLTPNTSCLTRHAVPRTSGLASHSGLFSHNDAVRRAAALDQASRRRQRLRATLIAIAALIILAFSAFMAEANIQKLLVGAPRFGLYISRTIPDIALATLWHDLAAWMWAFPRWMGLMVDTVIIAFLATVIGSFLGLVMSFLAARNTERSPIEGFVVRRLLDLTRTVPDLVFALIFVYAFGVGPMAGVFAIALHTMGTIGKLSIDVHEAADRRSIEALLAAGASWSQRMRWGVLPQGAPTILSYLLLRFEINVRGAAVVGFVGAGGIGQELSFVIKQFIYEDVSALIVILALTVMIIDVLSDRLRAGLLGDEQGHELSHELSHEQGDEQGHELSDKQRVTQRSVLACQGTPDPEPGPDDDHVAHKHRQGGPT